MPKSKVFTITGVMSGTSLDGLDMAFCIFKEQVKGWSYQIEHATTTPYPAEWKNKLLHLESASAVELCKADRQFGHYIGEQIHLFHRQHQLTPHYIASHGHTLFHQPEKQFTVQIGHGAAIAKETGIATICDFRSSDVAWGGQGAPLVPIGDELLFHEYDICLNLGGIANLSGRKNNARLSWDTSICNMALNYLANQLGNSYDEQGAMARTGKLLPQLLDKLNQLPYFQQPPPRSLGKEWFLANMLPLLQTHPSIPDLAHSVVHHIAFQIQQAVHFLQVEHGKLFITGGGTYHQFLIETIQSYCPTLELVIPDSMLIEFKEALIFAFLGLLRIEQVPNSLATVTGAQKDAIGGAIYLP